MDEIRKHYREVKTVLRKINIPDSIFPSKYSFSPYMACQHACKYCDGRAEKYYVDGDFEKDIIIRQNIPELLEIELTKVRDKGTILIGSGVSDPYQPVENKEGLMRKALEIISRYDFSVSIMTKSPIIIRDFDILEKISLKNKVLIMVSLTFTDDDKRKIFEPYAGSVTSRLEILRKGKENGFFTGVLAMPFLPGINDSKEDIAKLYETVAATGVDFIMPGGLTLRPGKQKDVYMDIIKLKFPRIYDMYMDMYSENRDSGSPKKIYTKAFFGKINTTASEYALPYLIPHYVYKDQFYLHDDIYILLNHMTALYSRRGTDIKPLMAGIKKYAMWLVEKRKEFARKRVNYKIVEDIFKESLLDGRMKNLIKNDKLVSFIKEVSEKGKIFDYKKLKLL